MGCLNEIHTFILTTRGGGESPSQIDSLVSAFVAGDRDGKVEDDDFWLVDLLYVNPDADFEVFAQNQQSQGRPNCSVNLRNIASIYDNDDQNPVKRKNAFVVYYPSKPQTVKQAFPSHEKQMEAASHGISDALEFLAWESGQTPSAGFPTYGATFHANTRGVAFGHIIQDPTFPPSAVHGRTCKLAQEQQGDMVGHSGCSGGMICQFAFLEGTLNAQVIGLFRGEVSNTALNRIMALTSDGVSELRKAAGSNGSNGSLMNRLQNP